jgi:taurine dioxygenase
MAFDILPLSHAIGAEITGLDLNAPLNCGTIADIRAAWLDHNVLLFRDQHLTPENHIAFSREFGTLDDHRSRPDEQLPGYPEIFMVTNLPRDDGRPSRTRNTGRQWHTDFSYTKRPAMGSLLHCREIPEKGGDTLFANMTMAWDSLSDGLKTLLSPLEAVHDAANIGNFRTRDQVEVQIIKDNNPPIVQPVMRQHPETGKPALYVTESATTHFVGMTAEESRPILKYLFKQSTRDEFIYRHRWRVGDLIMWDNRCTLHRALMDYSHESDRRHMLRTTILGEASGTLVSVSRRG